jgi:hypothetical protein
MLDDVERPDQRSKWRSGTPASSGSGALSTGRPSRFSAIARVLPSSSSASTLAELREHREIVAGAAADLEDLARRRLGAAADQRGEDLAPRAVPPVALIERGHLS